MVEEVVAKYGITQIGMLELYPADRLAFRSAGHRFTVHCL